MVKVTKMNKICISLTIIIIALMIGIPTSNKVLNKHNDKLIKVTEKRITEATKKCFIDEKCHGNEITLQDLYDNNYLNEEINPITKNIMIIIHQ